MFYNSLFLSIFLATSHNHQNHHSQIRPFIATINIQTIEGWTTQESNTEILNHRKSAFHFQSKKTFKIARPGNVSLPPISNGRDPLLLLVSPMTVSSAFAIPFLHLLSKPHTKSLMSVLAPPCSAMVIGNKYLDFYCVCVCERERERERERENLILLKINWISVCVCVCMREWMRQRGGEVYIVWFQIVVLLVIVFGI